MKRKSKTKGAKPKSKTNSPPKPAGRSRSAERVVFLAAAANALAALVNAAVKLAEFLVGL